MWYRLIVAASLAALVAALALIGPATAQPPVSGGHFRRALSSDPANLDPALTNTSRAIAVKMTIFDSLLRQNPKTLAIEPGAAESWSVSSDGKVQVRVHGGVSVSGEVLCRRQHPCALRGADVRGAQAGDPLRIVAE